MELHKTQVEAPSLSVEEESSDRRRSMSQPADFFEFRMPDFDSSYTFSWNDLIWPSISSAKADEVLLLPPSVSAKTRRSESLNESKIATQYSSLLKSPCFRASRSLDYCRLRRNPSSNQPIRSANTSGKAQARSPPWYWMMFGPLKFPQVAEMEARRSGKSRQSRPPATLFPAAEKRGWKLISVLSCKSHASVAVTTPFQPYC